MKISIIEQNLKQNDIIEESDDKNIGVIVSNVGNELNQEIKVILTSK